MSIPVISVIIPAYNEEYYLAKCLQSLSKQTLDPKLYEVIVVDNASTDKTPDIAKRYSVKLLRERRKSVVFARQKGVDHCQGQVIVSADADTIYPPNWLKKISDCFISHPRLIAIVGWVYYSHTPTWFNFALSLIQEANLWLGKTTGKFPIVYAANFAFKKSAFLKIGGYPAHLPELGDQQYLLFKLRELGSVMINPQIYCHTSPRKFDRHRFLNIIIYNGWYRLFGSIINQLFHQQIIGPTPAPRSRY